MHSDINTARKIVAAKQFIDAQFTDLISLDDMAAHAFMSRFHFHRIFTKTYRQTPCQYLRNRRLAYARQLLHKDNLTFSEICAASGYENIQSFSLLFKKDTGCTPGQFRAINHKKTAREKQYPITAIPGCFMHLFPGLDNSNNR